MRPTAALALALALSILAGADDGLSAEWRDDHKALRVGFLAISGAGYDSLRLEPFRAYLESRLALPVELVPAATYAALIDAQATDRVQYAIHSATSYVTAAATCGCVEPLALPAAFDGARGFYAILLARADGAIFSVADARGARLAVAGEDSIAGRLVPMMWLAREGIDPAQYFSAIVETASPEAAITALFTGEADLAVAWSSLTGDGAGGYDFGVLSRMIRDGVLSMDQIRPIWTSPLIPFGPHAVRRDLPDELKSQLLAALTAMAATAPQALDAVDRSSIGGGGFVAAGADDYAVIEALIGEPAPGGGEIEPPAAVIP
jgi:phosphonate transport system substrate-binding protein